MSLPDSRVDEAPRDVDPTPGRDRSDEPFDDLVRRLRSGAIGGPPTPTSGPRLPRHAGMYALLVAIAAGILGLLMAGWWPAATDTAQRLTSSLSAAFSAADEPAAPDTTASPGASPSVTARRPVRPVGPVTQVDVEGAAPAGVSSSPAEIPAPSATGTTPRIVEESFLVLNSASPASLVPVYSSADPDVRPPRIRLGELPRQAVGEPRTRTYTIELLVSAEGDVEQAKLRTTEPRMLDPLLLSRAKMWQFDPAQRQGQAVPYRLLLTWETPDR